MLAKGAKEVFPLTDPSLCIRRQNFLHVRINVAINLCSLSPCEWRRKKLRQLLPVVQRVESVFLKTQKSRTDCVPP